MFRKLMQALVVSTMATGVAVAVFRWLDGPPPKPSARPGLPEVDADALSDDERRALLGELDAQL